MNYYSRMALSSRSLNGRASENAKPINYDLLEIRPICMNHTNQTDLRQTIQIQTCCTKTMVVPMFLTTRRQYTTDHTCGILPFLIRMLLAGKF